MPEKLLRLFAPIVKALRTFVLKKIAEIQPKIGLHIDLLFVFCKFVAGNIATRAMEAKYINPFTDFGFKKVFGEEASKESLRDFLNALLPPQDKIVKLTFKNPEQLGQMAGSRNALYDIYCDNKKGEKFIIELQKARQNYFRERTIYYSTFPIIEQSQKGDWDFKLKAVYCIGILDFAFSDYKAEPDQGEVVHTVKLKNQNCEVFYDKLTYIYLEMPNFKKGEKELKTRLDKWLYFIRNLEDIQTIPAILKEEVFEQAFEKAALAKLDKKGWIAYENSLKAFRDSKNTVDYARKEGIIEGEIKGEKRGVIKKAIETATIMIRGGESNKKIIKYTRLTEKEIEKLRKEL